MMASYLGDYSHGVYDDSQCCDQTTDPGCKHTVNHEVSRGLN